MQTQTPTHPTARKAARAASPAGLDAHDHRALQSPDGSGVRRTIAGLISLTRPLNAIISFAGIAIAGLIAEAPQSAWPRVGMAALAGALIGSAGNIINDVHDVAIDRINKPHRAIAAGIVRPLQAIVWAAVCAACGLLLSAGAGATPFLIAAASIVILSLYSAVLKGIPLVGNLTVGIVTGAAFLFGAAAAGNLRAGIIPAIFAFLFNVGREILKDIEDMEGDRACGVRTLPLIHGTRTALVMTSMVFGLVIVLTPLPWLLGIYSVHYLIIVVAGVDLVLLAGILHAWKNSDLRTLARLNSVLKFDMLVGLTALWIG